MNQVYDGQKTARRTVGQSADRTPGKHKFLDKLIGQVIGTAITPRMSWIGDHPLYFLDLCAGDGANTGTSGTCSPSILMKHAYWGRHPEGRKPPFNEYRALDVRTIFTERDSASYDLLKPAVASMPGYNQEFDSVIRGDSREPGLIPLPDLSFPFSAVVHNDPNTVNDWAFTAELRGQLPDPTITVSTLGCNVGGLLRLPVEQRRLWFEHLGSVTSSMPRYHDAYLVALTGDAQKFAWVVTAPRRWRDDTRDNFGSAFNSAKYPAEGYWLGLDPGGFTALCFRLFNTKAERGEC